MGIRSIRQGESYFDRFARTRDGGFGTASDSVSATGGTKFTSGDYTYHFYVNDAFGPQPQPNKEFTLASGSSINVLVIGGGAGGQNDGGGGGGAGGIAHAENMPVSPGTFVATVGRGRAYADSPNTPEPSTFTDPSGPVTITGLGGGQDGGSGGGGGQPNRAGGTGNQPNQNTFLSYVTNYGNTGGQGGPGDQGGGGGGAGQAGGAGSASPSGAGGAGQPIPNFPGPQLYTDMPGPLQSTVGTGWRDALGTAGNFAGGGGGGSSPGAPGGIGGGGDGDTAQGAGVNYTGSGGAGGPSSPNQPGASGGNGIIVVYYPT